MAEFCFDCWNKLMGADYPAENYVLPMNWTFVKAAVNGNP